MLIPNRFDSLDDYRYGFQGQEKDDEVKGEGNSLNYTFRMHDPRVGRFFAVDPLFRQYPWNSPYAFSENMPIQFNELEGLEVGSPIFYAKMGAYGETTQKVVTAVEDGTEEFVTGIYNFATKDVWSKETWKNAWSLYTEVADAASYGTSTRRPPSTPALDAMAADFKKNVIDGDTYSRTKYATVFILGVLGTKGMDKVKTVVNISKLNNIKPRIFSKNFIIGPKTLNQVSKHLEQFGDRAENTVMLDRMKKIAANEMEPTDIDINFAKHELREKQLMDGGMKYEDAHFQTLQEQGMYHKDYDKKLYTPEAIEAGNKQAIKEASK